MSKHITVRIPDQLEEIMSQFCKEEDRSRSWFIKRAIEDKLEDWQDLRDGIKALKKHQKNPSVISHDNLLKELDLEAEDLK